MRPFVELQCHGDATVCNNILRCALVYGLANPSPIPNVNPNPKTKLGSVLRSVVQLTLTLILTLTFTLTLNRSTDRSRDPSADHASVVDRSVPKKNQSTDRSVSKHGPKHCFGILMCFGTLWSVVWLTLTLT